MHLPRSANYSSEHKFLDYCIIRYCSCTVPACVIGLHRENAVICWLSNWSNNPADHLQLQQNKARDITSDSVQVECRFVDILTVRIAATVKLLFGTVLQPSSWFELTDARPHLFGCTAVHVRFSGAVHVSHKTFNAWAVNTCSNRLPSGSTSQHYLTAQWNAFPARGKLYLDYILIELIISPLIYQS